MVAQMVYCDKGGEEMPEPLSQDMRQRIIAAKGRGDSHAKIAKELQVSVSAITRLLALYRETGNSEPRTMHLGRKPRLDEQTLEKIRKRIEEQPDVALYELKEEFALPVSLPALCKTINGKLGLRRKKNGTRSRTASDGCGAQEETLEKTSINS